MSDGLPQHHCHARKCDAPCEPERLMCGKHWSMVPRAIQKAVWENYRRGQCDDKDPSEAWHKAADAAIAYVLMAEDAGMSPSIVRAIDAMGRGDGVMCKVGKQTWVALRKGHRDPRKDQKEFNCGTVTVNRLVAMGLAQEFNFLDSPWFKRARLTEVGRAWCRTEFSVQEVPDADS